jgi:hypothetical protein
VDFNLIDLNGDGLSDIVFVLADSVKYLLNKNGREFEPLVTMTTASLASGAIPDGTNMATRLADMNGNGSTDIVWINSSGVIQYLEMFPMRPNLLNRVDNGIGKVIEASYGSSVEHMARDGGARAWADRMPYPMLTLERLETYDTLSNNRLISSYRYHNGWYDGVEKQFRGFADVEILVEGDASMRAGRTTQRFDIGKTDPYRKGLLTAYVQEDSGVVIHRTSNEFTDCPVAEVPAGVTPAVRHLCLTARHDVSEEGRAATEWVTRETQYTYDGYGNRTSLATLGITSVGGSACGPCTREAGEMGEPCGADCLGDETYSESTFVPPSQTGGRWMLHVESGQRAFSRPGSVNTEEVRNYYDGAAFEGLPQGQLTLGNLTRTERRIDAGDHWQVMARSRFNADGHVVEILDANSHRRKMEYSANGLALVAENMVFDDPSHEPYELRMELTVDPVTLNPLTSSGWMLVKGGAVVSPPNPTTYHYDAQGQMVAVVEPGDDDAAPSKLFQVDIGDPTTPSRIMTRTRSTAGGTLGQETIKCLDGMGRVYQHRNKVADGVYDVDGFVVFNAKGMEKRLYQSYLGTSSRCDAAPPANVAFAESQYDAMGRLLSVTKPDGSLYGTPSVVRTEYWPRFTTVWDEADNDPQSASYDSPTTTWMDGLGRKYKEVSNAGSAYQVTTFYAVDELGHPARMADSTGTTKRQTSDFIGRVLSTQDPDMGTAESRYDALGNRLWHKDARGDIAFTAFDEANRMSATWADSDPVNTRVEYTHDQVAGCAPADCRQYLGRLVSLAYPFRSGAGFQPASDTFEYNNRGWMTAYVRNLEGHAFRFESAFDNMGRDTGKLYPDGHRLAWTLDGLGRHTSIPGVVDRVVYDSGKTIDGLTLNNGVTVQYDSDVLSRAVSMVARDPAGTPVASLGYVHDRMGNLTSVVDALAQTGTPSGNAVFGFDGRFNLVSAVLDHGTPREEQLNYSYDLMGNLTGKVSSLGTASKEHVGTYSYGEHGAGPHSATRAGDVTLDYDARGHVTRKGTDTYAWDAFGSLISANRGNRRLADYAYDGMGVRIRRKDPNADSYYLQPGFEVRDGISQLYVEAGGQRVALIESASMAADLYSDLAPAQEANGTLTPAPDHAITAADAWLAHAAGHGLATLAAGVTASPEHVLLRSAARRMLLTDDAGNPVDRKTYFLHDYQGSTIASLDESGHVLQRTEYYPMGTERYQSAGYRETYSFKSLETEDSSELTYIKPRYRDQRLAVWLSPNWQFFALDPTLPPEDRVIYGQNVHNPVRSPVSSPVTPPAKAMQPVAAAGLQVSGASPPQSPARRAILTAALSGPAKYLDPVRAPEAAKLAETSRLPSPALQVFTPPPRQDHPPPPPHDIWVPILSDPTPPTYHVVQNFMHVPEPEKSHDVTATLAGRSCDNFAAVLDVGGKKVSYSFDPKNKDRPTPFEEKHGGGFVHQTRAEVMTLLTDFFKQKGFSDPAANAASYMAKLEGSMENHSTFVKGLVADRLVTATFNETIIDQKAGPGRDVLVSETTVQDSAGTKGGEIIGWKKQ